MRVIVLSLLLFAGVVNVVFAGQCETCKSLDYDCLPPTPVIKNHCGQIISPDTCTWPSCDDYCLRLRPTTPVGVCNAVSHTCDCAAATVDVEATPEPIAISPSVESLPECASVLAGLACFPANLQRFHPECSQALPSCNTQCGTTSGSTCSSSGTSCFCAVGGTSTNVSIGVPSSGSPVKKTSVRGSSSVGVTTITDPITTYSSTGTMEMGRGAIVGTILNGSMGLVIFIANIVYFAMQLLQYKGVSEAKLADNGLIPLRFTPSTSKL